MAVEMKKILVDDIRSKITDLDLRKKMLQISFKELAIFLEVPTSAEQEKKKKIFQYDDANTGKISPALNIISDELANVYTLIEQLMKNIKLYSPELKPMIEPPQSLGGRLSNMLSGNKPQQTNYTGVTNPMAINVDLMEEARALPKIWEVYMWDMRRRFILEAEYWKNISLQRGNLLLEKDYLFGIVQPRMQKLFNASKDILEEKIMNKETSILIRELSDEQKMFMPPTPAGGQSAPQTPPK